MDKLKENLLQLFYSGDDAVRQLLALGDIKFGQTQKERKYKKSKCIHNRRKKCFF